GAPGQTPAPRAAAARRRLAERVTGDLEVTLYWGLETTASASRSTTVDRRDGHVPGRTGARPRRLPPSVRPPRRARRMRPADLGIGRDRHRDRARRLAHELKRNTTSHRFLTMLAPYRIQLCTSSPRPARSTLDLP